MTNHNALRIELKREEQMTPEQLVKWRCEQGMSVKVFCRAMGISDKRLHYWERVAIPLFAQHAIRGFKQQLHWRNMKREQAKRKVCPQTTNNIHSAEDAASQQENQANP